MQDKKCEERAELVARLKSQGIVKSREVERALLSVPRHEFVWPSTRRCAYEDTPLPLGQTGQTISAVHMVAIMDELLQLRPGLKVLEVGTGSGYHAATVAEIVAPLSQPPESWGHVYTLEIVEELFEFATSNLERTGYSSRVSVIMRDGSLGYPEAAPYDRVLVTAAAPSIPPPLVEQMSVGGIIVIPLGGEHFFQELVVGVKTESGKLKTSEKGGVAFVPLRGAYGW
ncbi:MAG: protein-L-isoaspartate(D-aspartate) O-methyltransferase [Candidatus Brockarchaeota archaeon]|nr:protein-L-isoaspartate(D-aspartate) O-methyltransferase [Candidatus Brockarchaeota archaeon]